jgi:peptidoglycan hydrolase CwlO-like protein
METAELRQEVETEAKNELQSLVKSIEAIDAELEPLETQHRNLRRLALNGTFSEEEYRDSKEELVVEQTRLKQEKRRLQKTRENSWIEPTRDLVNTLEMAGKSNISESFPDLSKLVQKLERTTLFRAKPFRFHFLNCIKKSLIYWGFVVMKL